MSRYLFVMCEGGGTVPPEVSIAQRLVARGHQVRVIADPTIEASARAAGCGFVAWREAPHVKGLRPEDALIRDWELKSPLAVFAQARDRLLCGPALRFAQEVLVELEGHPADALAVDMMMLGGLIAGEKARLPTALLIPNLYPFPSPGRPVLGSGAAMPKGFRGRLRAAVSAWLMERVFNTGLPALNDARRALGLAPIARTFELHERVERALVLSCEAFDFTGPPYPSHVRFVGAELGDPHWALPFRAPWTVDDTRPLVLVALSSTFQDQAATLQRIIDALGALDVRAVVTKGPALREQELRAPANVCVVEAAPHAQLLCDAAAVVSHCGHGTTLKTLAAGVPLLCMPMGRDQVDNAVRVAHHGAGIRISRAASVERIRAGVRVLLAEPSYRANAARMARSIHAELEQDRAVAELERLAARGAQHTGCSRASPGSDGREHAHPK
jgi:MGT family glycosyltransferase